MMPRRPKEIMDELAAEGILIKTKRTRYGKPVYVARQFATAEEVAAWDRERLQ
jgi:hypothetical protein